MAALTLAAATAVALAAGARADLPAGEVRCGQITCPRHYYCSQFDQLCRPCDRVCDPESKSYVEPTCEKYCQDYIHDGRYVSPSEIERLSKKVASLTIVSSVGLVLALLLALVLGTLVVRKIIKHKHLLWRFTKRGASHASGKKMGSSEDPEAGPKAAEVAAAASVLQRTTPAPDDSPPPPLSRSVSREVATPQTTSTPLSRPRHPSEDTTLDYAYDNPALAPSPSPGKEHTSSASPTLNGSAGTYSVAVVGSAMGTPVPTAAVGFGGRKESSF